MNSMKQSLHGYLLFPLLILRLTFLEGLDEHTRERNRLASSNFVALCVNQKWLCNMRICSDQMEKINPLHVSLHCSNVIFAFVDDFIPDEVLQQRSLILDCDSFCVTPS